MAFLSSRMVSYLTLVSPSFSRASASETQYLNVNSFYISPTLKILVRPGSGPVQAYNVTNFLDDHPGGEEVLLAAAGKPSFESLLIKIIHSVDFHIPYVG